MLRLCHLSYEDEYSKTGAFSDLALELMFPGRVGNTLSGEHSRNMIYVLRFLLLASRLHFLAISSQEDEYSNIGAFADLALKLMFLRRTSRISRWNTGLCGKAVGLEYFNMGKVGFAIAE